MNYIKGVKLKNKSVFLLLMIKRLYYYVNTKNVVFLDAIKYCKKM